MSETSMAIASSAPQAVYLKDYQIPNFLTDEVELHIDLKDDVTVVKSHMRIRHHRLANDQNRNLVLNGEELTLESIRLNGKQLAAGDYILTNKTLTIPNAPDDIDLEIVVKIYPQNNTALSGLYRSGQTYCTQCEAHGFRRITYFQDHPDILSRFITTIYADAKRFPILLSNGNLVDSGSLPHDRHWAKWSDPFKKPSYLFAMVAGDFDLLADKFTTVSGRDIDLKIYVEKGYVDQAKHAMYSLKEAMSWDEKTYGREYDLDIYMIVAIGDFNMGAMENKGLNIFNTACILAKPETATDSDFIHVLAVVGHEYFHNWSGNRVTCRDWFQLSLKEGLTIFREQSFTEDTLSEPVMRIQEVNYLRESQFPEDAGPLAHPVRPDSYIEINNFYTSTVYNKGSEVLRMLQTILGKGLFRKGMDLYFAKYDGQAVTIDDYVQTMEDVSGIDLTQFKRWYSQAGTPVVTATDHYDAAQKRYTLTFKQSCSATPGQPVKQPFYIPIKLGLLAADGSAIPLSLAENKLETVLAFTEPEQTFVFKNIVSKPVPSLLRHFSAPVKLHYAYSDEDLYFLCLNDTDAFNSWEAAQKYALNVMLKLITDYQQRLSLTVPHELIEMYLQIIGRHSKDQFFTAELLTLPSEKYIGEQMSVVDVDAIHSVREFVLREIAAALHLKLAEVYRQCHDVSGFYEFDMHSIGKRQLKNRCLSYLMLLPQYHPIGIEQFTAALKVNMTDTQAALITLANSDSPSRQQALNQFYTTWQQDALVVDKWLAIQAAAKLPDTLQQVQQLTKHEAFDLKNPNKVYALIGSFGRNAACFHASNGDGYVFLREVIQQLDKLNPQVAARMVKPLTSWRRYDKERQKLMCKQLELLLQDKSISSDLFELVSKSLAE